MSEDKNEVVKDDEEAVKEKKPVKKKNKDAEVNGSNNIELEPTLNEAEGKTVVFNFGRMNPVTTGHEKLANKMKQVAKKEKADTRLYLTHSNDPKKNPLTHKDKVKFAKKAFGNIVVDSPANTIIKVMQDLDGTYQNAILVVGADRIADFKKLLNQYNGKEYNFDSIQVVSAGDRDPDAEDVTGMSASKMRAMAKEDKFDEFAKGVPSKLKSQGKAMFDAVRKGMKISEEVEELLLTIDEALTFQQRQAKSRSMRRNKAKMLAGRKRSMRRKPTQEKIKKRAERRAKEIIRKKIIGAGKKSYDDMSYGERSAVDAKVAKKKAVIQRIAKKLIPIIRKEAMGKAAGVKESLDQSFDTVFEAIQDSDIKDKKGTQPAKYYSGLAKSTKDKRDAHFKKGAKMDDNNPAAYKPAPGDAEAKTKESEHTKKARAMYGEDIEEASCNDTKPKKRYHEARKKDGTIKLDGRFKAFKKKPQPIEESFETDSQLLELIDQVAMDINESLILDEAKADVGLKKKAEKSGMPLDVLRQVYNRGVAAWRTGHRPGVTPQQWGFARVNSFITKSSGTWGKADADLAAKVRSEEVEIDEAPRRKGAPKMTGDSIAIQRAKDAEHNKAMGRTKTGRKKPVRTMTSTQRSLASLSKEEVELDETLSPAEKKLISQMYDKKGNLTALGKKVMDHGKASAKEELSLDEVFEALNEKLKVSDGAGAWVKDFYKSDAPQFKGKSKEERQKMAVAAYLDAKGEQGEQEEAVSPAQQAAIAISKKEKAGKPGYDKEGKSLKEFFTPDEQFELTEASIIDKALAAIHKHVVGGTALGDIAFEVSRARGVNTSARSLEKQYISKYGSPKKKVSIKDLDTKVANIKKRLKFEDNGAGDEGTDKLVKKYKKDTPNENINEEFEDLMEAQCDLIGMNQIKQFEKIVDQLFKKFGIDFNFTRHFGDRMGDDRNTPCISMKELANFIKKIYAKQGKSLKGIAGAEAVIKDLQTDLNIPVAVTYDQRKDEFDVVMKTIMRKKNFKSPDKIIGYK
tara:strand:- start:13435 stop:16506 length:3072 start_codon:yes stop_codon:yes gene_type:complete